jgi:hypothetical protein
MPKRRATASKGPLVLARAMSHPERLRILMKMNTPLRRLSPVEHAREAGVPVNTTAYHFRVLKKAGCIEVVDIQQRRGATEHFYEPVQRAMAWRREWSKFPAIVKENLAAVSLRGFVEAVGAAVDAGMYDKRDESQIANDTFWADELAFTEASRIFDRALKELLTVASEARERLGRNANAESFLLSYGLAMFETAPKKPSREGT